jgi:hypothetical protein
VQETVTVWRVCSLVLLLLLLLEALILLLLLVLPLHPFQELLPPTEIIMDQARSTGISVQV